jgi:hypothetical protein
MPAELLLLISMFSMLFSLLLGFHSLVLHLKIEQIEEKITQNLNQNNAN